VEGPADIALVGLGCSHILVVDRNPAAAGDNRKPAAGIAADCCSILDSPYCVVSLM